MSTRSSHAHGATLCPYTTLFRSTTEVRDLLERRLHEVVEGTAQLYGATAKLTYKRDYPVTRNHERQAAFAATVASEVVDRKSTRLNSSHLGRSYAVFCLKKKKQA